MTASTLLPDSARRHEPAGARDVQPCFGIACRMRASCACYDAVEDAPGSTTMRATCLGDGGYPGYRPCGYRGITRPA